MIGDREGDRSRINLSPLESTMNRGIQKIGDRLIEKMMFFCYEAIQNDAGIYKK